MNRRNRISYHIGRKLAPILLHKYHYHCNRIFVSEEPTLILANHLTEIDAFAVMRAFPKPMRVVAGAHLLEKRAGKILSKLISPIFLPRGSKDYSSILQIIESLKEESVLLFPEGCRSFNGETLTSPISLAKLVKMAHCQVVTFKIIGGYFVAPRWAYTTRKGKMRGEIVNLYSKEDIQKMSLAELNKKLNEDIYENAYERQKAEQNDYKGKRLAEGIENYLELCPSCGSFDSIVSHGNEFGCRKCDLKGEYSKKGFLMHVPFSSTLEWGNWQDAQLEEFSKKEGLLFTSEAKEYIIENNIPIDQGKASLKAYSDHMLLNDLHIPYQDISSYSLLYYGRTLLFSYQGTYYKLSDFLAYKFAKLIEFGKARKGFGFGRENNV